MKLWNWLKRFLIPQKGSKVIPPKEGKRRWDNMKEKEKLRTKRRDK